MTDPSKTTQQDRRDDQGRSIWHQEILVLSLDPIRYARWYPEIQLFPAKRQRVRALRKAGTTCFTKSLRGWLAVLFFLATL